VKSSNKGGQDTREIMAGFLRFSRSFSVQLGAMTVIWVSTLPGEISVLGFSSDTTSLIRRRTPPIFGALGVIGLSGSPPENKR